MLVFLKQLHHFFAVLRPFDITFFTYDSFNQFKVCLLYTSFLNSAVGAKAASFKTILFIAGIGIFIGASLSNGMMDICEKYNLDYEVEEIFAAQNRNKTQPGAVSYTHLCRANPILQERTYRCSVQGQRGSRELFQTASSWWNHSKRELTMRCV